jgi:chromosome segregation ATPase
MSDLEQKLQDHDHRLRLMEDQSLRNTEQMAALLGELHDLSSSLRETVSTFREYAVKHDNLTESNKVLWSKYEKQSEAISEINLTNAKNQEVINSVVAIKNKVMGVVILAILSPISIGAAIVFTQK